MPGRYDQVTPFLVAFAGPVFYALPILGRNRDTIE